MYLLFIIKVPKEQADPLEENFYFIPGLSWEREEEDDKVLFKFYFPLSLKPEDQEKLEQLEKISAQYSELNTEYSLLERENWEVIWRYHFKPLRVGKKLLILPTWEEAPKESSGEIIIYIDPGQAFGTGHHATTQLMLENLEIFLEELAQDKEKLLILDLGCGTGILSIAAARLCPQAKIYAIDIDELALEATKQNAKLNKVEKQIEIMSAIPDEAKDIKFDLILANIGFKELKDLAPSLLKYCLPKQTLLSFSGILREDLPYLEKIYLSLGFQKIKSQFLKEWSFLALMAPTTAT